MMMDTFSRFFGMVFQESLKDQIRLESMEDDRTLTLKDGSFLSVIALSGAFRNPGEAELADMVERMRIGLSPYLSQPGHAMEINFMRDPQTARRTLERLVNRSQRSARNLSLDLEDVLNERISTLSRWMVAETCLICLYTRTDVLTAEEINSDIQIAKKRLASLPTMMRAQTPGKNYDAVFSRHGAFVDAFDGLMKQSGQMSTILSISQALQEIRAGLYPETAAMKDEWVPHLPRWSNETPAFGKPGDRALVMAPETPAQVAGFDFSNLGIPTFDDQIATEDAIVDDARTVLIGGTRFASFDMTLAPEVLPEFNALVADINAKSSNIPWRASMRIESGGVQAQRLKMMYLSIFTWSAPQYNRRLRDALMANSEIDGRSDAVVRFRMSFSTWAPRNDADGLRRNAQTLMGAVKRWGNSGIDGISGDPLATTLSASPGLTTASTAPVASGPLADVLAMGPFARQASPWQNGAVLMRTATGKPWPYQPGSSKQTAWVTILVGTPGSGKSVMMNAINFASAISPSTAGGDEPVLPRIAIIDIGPSSAGLISLLQEALPANRRNEVVFQRLRMDRANAINVFDTQLGIRKPLSSERIFLINFLTLICGDGETPPSAAMRGLISATVDQAYDDLADDRNPRRYLPDEVPAVDKALAEIDFVHDPSTIWWEVVDILAESGYLDEAEIAQRQAVPTLADLVTASQADQVSSLYGEATDKETGQPILASFQRMISEVVRDYPILSSHTRYSLGSARIVSMDLMDVTARGSGSAALKQTAIMYMLARQVMTRDFFISEDEIRLMNQDGHMPDSYLDHHIVRARNNLEVPKIICMDEFHRTGNIDAITNQVLQDAREGRKFNVDIKIASQLMEDFPKAVVDVASTVIVCNAGSERSINYMSESFSLTDNERSIIRYNLRGPSSRGAPIWALLKTRDHGEVRQELFLTLGPIELWAFSTTAEDVALRSRLYGLIGPKLTRKVLSARFPGGSAKGEIETRIARLEEQGERMDDQGRGNVIGDLVNELKEQAFIMDR